LILSCLSSHPLEGLARVVRPKRLLKALGVEGEAYFLVELAPEGGLLLRPAGVYPLEVYTEERLQELLAEDTLTEEERARLAALAR
jgi:hypothetical protein